MVAYDLSVRSLASSNSSSMTPPMARNRWPFISLIIPTLNESKNLPLVLPFIPGDWVDEVILVDGRSTDGTIETAKDILPSIKVVLEEEHGKGAALQAGYRASSGDILVVMDADGSNDPREIPRFIAPLFQGADMVKGSRFAPGGGTTDMPRIRKWGNGAFVTISNLLFGTKFTDLCYGYHAFWSHSLDFLDLEEINGFEIDTSIYLQAVRNGLHIVDVPSFEGLRFHGMGKLQTIPDGFRVIRTIGREWLLSLVRKDRLLSHGFRGLKPDYAIEHGGTSSGEEENREFALRHLWQMVGSLISQAKPWEKTFERLLRILMDLMAAQTGSLVLVNERGYADTILLAYGDTFDVRGGDHIREIVEEGLAGWVIRNSEPAIVGSTLDDPRWIRSEWEVRTNQEARSALAIPLAAEREVLGVLTLVRDGNQPFGEDELLLARGTLTPHI